MRARPRSKTVANPAAQALRQGAGDERHSRPRQGTALTAAGFIGQQQHVPVIQIVCPQKSTHLKLTAKKPPEGGERSGDYKKDLIDGGVFVLIRCAFCETHANVQTTHTAGKQ